MVKPIDNANASSKTTASNPGGFFISKAYKESEIKALEAIQTLPSCDSGSCSGCWACDFDFD